MRFQRVFLDQPDAAARLGEPVEEMILVGNVRAVLAAAVRVRARRITVETDAAAIDDAVARALASAGVRCVRLRARTPAAIESAARALAAAGITPELVVALREGQPRVSAAVDALIVDAAGVPLEAAARAVDALVESTRAGGPEVRLDSATFVPPCTFEHPDRVAYLYSLSPGGAARPGYARVAACAPCVVSDRCPGLPSGAGVARPILEDRTRRRLSIVSTPREQIARELVSRELYRGPDGKTAPMATVRINFHCNQACEFCFVSTHLPAADDAAIRAAICEIAHQGGVLALSGGEPTLNPRLSEYARLGKREGARYVELQTNAIRLADAALVAELAPSVDAAFVSLHGASAAVSDRVTRAPGTFEKTLAGIDELARSPMALRLNFVLCTINHHEFPAWVDLVARRWPRAVLTVSFVAPSTDLVPRTPELVPRFSDIAPALADGLRRAAAAGLAVTGFESMCGVPPCVVPDDVRPQLDFAELPPALAGEEFVKTDTCAACAADARCYGLRRGYAEIHGTSELRAL